MDMKKSREGEVWAESHGGDRESGGKKWRKPREKVKDEGKRRRDKRRL